jgi:hypothetical protein
LKWAIGLLLTLASAFGISTIVSIYRTDLDISASPAFDPRSSASFPYEVTNPGFLRPFNVKAACTMDIPSLHITRLTAANKRISEMAPHETRAFTCKAYYSDRPEEIRNVEISISFDLHVVPFYIWHKQTIVTFNPSKQGWIKGQPL